MRTFWLHRTKDVTGLSGTGIVCEGVEFSDGRCVMRWIDDTISSIVIHKSIKDIETLHGHGGNTTIIYGNVLDEIIENA